MRSKISGVTESIGGDELGWGGWVGKVGDDEGRVEVGGDNFTEAGFESVDEHAGAFGRATAGDGFADAGRTAGDDDDFVGETHGLQQTRKWWMENRNYGADLAGNSL